MTRIIDGDRITGVIACDCLTYAAPIYAEGVTA